MFDCLVRAIYLALYCQKMQNAPDILCMTDSLGQKLLIIVAVLRDRLIWLSCRQIWWNIKNSAKAILTQCLTDWRHQRSTDWVTVDNVHLFLVAAVVYVWNVYYDRCERLIVSELNNALSQDKKVIFNNFEFLGFYTAVYFNHSWSTAFFEHRYLPK